MSDVVEENLRGGKGNGKTVSLFFFFFLSTKVRAVSLIVLGDNN